MSLGFSTTYLWLIAWVSQPAHAPPYAEGDAYDALVEEFMSEMRSWQPRCLVQFEDFGNANAFRILEKYRHVQPCFNDDIQGTACIALAGLLSGLRATGQELTEQRVLFLVREEIWGDGDTAGSFCVLTRYLLRHEQAFF